MSSITFAADRPTYNLIYRQFLASPTSIVLFLLATVPYFSAQKIGKRSRKLTRLAKSVFLSTARSSKRLLQTDTITNLQTKEMNKSEAIFRLELCLITNRIIKVLFTRTYFLLACLQLF